MSLAHGAEIVKRPEVTHDAFLGGRLTIAQPARGFRAGLDSVLLGASTGHGQGQLLDLGAGGGCVGKRATEMPIGAAQRPQKRDSSSFG